jgi:hypothetical protein
LFKELLPFDRSFTVKHRSKLEQYLITVHTGPGLIGGDIKTLVPVFMDKN